MKLIIVALLLIFLSGSSLAQTTSKKRFMLEPITGLETSLVPHPEPPRFKTRATYGARLLYGTTPLSGELEYTTAHSRSDYPSSDQVVSDKHERINLGLRSTFPMAKVIGFYLRAGGSASQGETKVKKAGVEETHQRALSINPYGGAGLQLAIHSHLALNAGATLIRNSESKFDTQYTFGISTKFGGSR